MNNLYKNAPSQVKDGMHVSCVGISDANDFDWLLSEIRISPYTPYKYCIEYKTYRIYSFECVTDRCFGKPIYTRWDENIEIWCRYSSYTDSGFVDEHILKRSIIDFVSSIEASKFIEDKIEERKKEIAFMSQDPIIYVRS